MLPWRLPRVDRRSARLAGQVAHAVAGWRQPRLRVRRDGTDIVVEAAAEMAARRYQLAGAAVLSQEAFAARLADPTAGVAQLRAGPWRGFAIVPGRTVRTLAQQVLGGPDELTAPRPLTVAERAVLIGAVAAALDDLDLSVEVEPTELGGAQLATALGGDVAVVEIVVEGRGQVLLAWPADALAAVRRPLDELAAAASWLDTPQVAPVIVARTRLERATVAALRPRDVVVATPVARAGEALIVVGRGGVRVARQTGTVVAAYQRGTMDETLGDDATVDVTVAIGDARLTVRGVLELAPGQVVELGKPPGGAVELRVGTRVVARGELVDVDGELGVRVISVG